MDSCPHQDAPAFNSFGPRYHITMMVSIDPCNKENGCLEMVPGHHRQGILPTAADATIDPDIAETLDWKLLPSEIGDIVFFDSYIPHRSGPNRSTNRSSDHREKEATAPSIHYDVEKLHSIDGRPYHRVFETSRIQAVHEL